MPHPIHHELANHQRLREKLVAEFPNADEETLRDTLEGMTNLAEMLAAVLRSGLDDQAMAKGLKGRMSEMQERLSRIEALAEKKRELVTSAMEQAGIRKLTEPDFTVSLRATRPPLVLTKEDEIPAKYWNAQRPRLDRQELIAALNTGALIPGAMLGNGGVTISVRVK
jgi:hypothetical protein